MASRTPRSTKAPKPKPFIQLGPFDRRGLLDIIEVLLQRSMSFSDVLYLTLLALKIDFQFEAREEANSEGCLEHIMKFNKTRDFMGRCSSG